MEAAFVAGKIKEITDPETGLKVEGKDKTMHPVQYKDIVILMRGIKVMQISIWKPWKMQEYRHMPSPRVVILSLWKSEPLWICFALLIIRDRIFP